MCQEQPLSLALLQLPEQNYFYVLGLFNIYIYEPQGGKKKTHKIQILPIALLGFG